MVCGLRVTRRSRDLPFIDEIANKHTDTWFYVCMYVQYINSGLKFTDK